MRNESCRKCGNEMGIKQHCSNCKDPIKYECKNCNFETDEQIHFQCILIEKDHRSVIAKVA